MSIDTLTPHSSIPHKILNRGKRKARAVRMNPIPMIFPTRQGHGPRQKGICTEGVSVHNERG
jgi:hypothetical protein